MIHSFKKAVLSSFIIGLMSCGGGGGGSSKDNSTDDNNVVTDDTNDDSPLSPPVEEEPRIDIIPGSYHTSYANASPNLFGCGLLENYELDDELSPIFELEIDKVDNFWRIKEFNQGSSEIDVTVIAFDECDGIENIVTLYSDDFLLVGKNLMQKMILDINQESFMSAILGISYGYFVQNAYSQFNHLESTTIRTTLISDALMGYYKYQDRDWDELKIENFYLRLYRQNVLEFHQDETHGTLESRIEAAKEGLELARREDSQGSSIQISEIIDELITTIDRQILIPTHTDTANTVEQ